MARYGLVILHYILSLPLIVEKTFNSIHYYTKYTDRALRPLTVEEATDDQDNHRDRRSSWNASS
jgi:hypothetical protein